MAVNTRSAVTPSQAGSPKIAMAGLKLRVRNGSASWANAAHHGPTHEAKVREIRIARMRLP
jgi:hypothetical protein